MDIFEQRNYKAFVREWILSRPKRGRGQYRAMAEHLRVGSVLISQIFKGTRDLSSEQAYELASFFEFNELQTQYWLLLVQKDRAGTHPLKQYYEAQLEGIRTKSRDLSHRVRSEAALSEEAASIFYSSWIYSAVRLATSIPALQSAEAIAKHLGVSKARVLRILHFLVAEGLCRHENGKYLLGSRTTHLAANSPWITKLHTHWRLRGMEAMGKVEEGELFYTSPVSIAAEDIPKVRKLLVELIEEFSKKVKDSPEETLACLNIDWFHLIPK